MKRNLKYTVFVGDGDTDCFGRVHDECKRVHGDSYIVTKEECIGHVQKRLGTALRKYKSVMRGTLMADRKSAGGKGRLTDKVIDKMQNFFGQAIRNAEGDKQIMIKDIWAVLMHMVHENGSSFEKQHDNCPKRNDSWCKYWSDRASYDDTKRLPAVFFDELKPIFVRLSSDELVNWCLKGLTQNQNESAYGILWSKCPKSKFCGRHRLVMATAETVCHINSGAGHVAEILYVTGLKAGANMLATLRKIDNIRIKRAAKKLP